MTFIQKENSFVTDTVNNYVSFDTKIYYAGGRSPLKLRLRLVLQYYQWKGKVNKKNGSKNFKSESEIVQKSHISAFCRKNANGGTFSGQGSF